MIRCFHCHEYIRDERDMVLVSCDGDFVHGQCKEAYDKERDHFLNVVLHDDTLFNQWLFHDRVES